MDDQAKYEALKGEFETVPACLLRPGAEAKVVHLRAFKDQGGLVRLDVATEDKADQFQLVVGADDLVGRITDPQM